MDNLKDINGNNFKINSHFSLPLTKKKGKREL